MPNNREKFDCIQAKINALDPDKIHILYFSYYLNWHNFYHSPLILSTKLLAFVTRKPSIDHVCHISRFVQDGEDQIAKIFEASVEMMMQQNDLRDKMEAMQGKMWIETLGKVDKTKAKEHQNEYLGVRYSKTNAAVAGFGKVFKWLDIKRKFGLLCPWLTGLFLESQGIIKKMDFSKFIPLDIWNLNLGTKTLSYDSKLFK